MAITETQRIERRGFMGSSDIAAILGLDRYRSAMDVWAEKTGRLPDPDQAREVADIGTMIEPGLVTWGAREMGVPETELILNERVVHPAGIVAVNFDAIAKDRTVSFEGKTSGLMGPIPEKDQWGEAGSCDVPMRHIIQCQTHFSVVDSLGTCYLAALLGGIGRRIYEIKRDAELVGMIVDAAHDFFRNHVEKDIPPDAAPSPETFKRMRRISGKRVKVAASVVEAWQQAKERAKLAEKMVEEASAPLRQAFGDAEIAEYEVSEGVDRYVIYFETHRKGYEVKATSFRTLRAVNSLK